MNRVRSRRRSWRRGRSSSPPFRAWGLVLTVLLVVLISQHAWVESLWVGLMLCFYLVAVRRALCRVQTMAGRPCRWRVRGLIGSCDYHVGLKRGLPVLAAPDGFGLPMFMWRRPDFAPIDATKPEPQPSPKARGDAVLPSRQRQFNMDHVMVGLAVGSLLVAIASFVRDLVAG
jgi:hypothetical protein